MNSDNDLLARALSNWATRMAAGHRLQAEAFDILVASLTDTSPRPWGAASALPLQERPQRQALLLSAVQLRAQELDSSGIPRPEWLRLATHFGYDPRGTAGFFRRSPDGSDGLLIKEADRDFVRLANAGFRRIEEFQRVVEESRSQIAVAVREVEAATSG